MEANFKNVVIINRWRDEYADYEKFINHEKNNVAYISNLNGSIYLKNRPNLKNYNKIVEDLSDIEKVKDAMVSIINEIGPIDKVIALSEFDIYVAAQIREIFSIDGMWTKDALKVVDKIEMKRNLINSSIRFPKYVEDINRNKIIEFINKVGYPIVLKPRKGASSEGVIVIKELREIDSALKDINLKFYECEEYIDGEIAHVDGIIQNGEIIFIKPSKYINTCYEYTLGKPVGSIIINDVEKETLLVNFTKKVIKGLNLKDSVFHLEVILKNGNEPVFLEIGARQGGGEIVTVMKDLYNVDLMRANFKVQLGEKILIKSSNREIQGGFLLVPEPKEVPCVVKEIISVKGLSTLKEEILPKIGNILDGKGGYYDISGRFIFIGSSKNIEMDMLRVINEYKIITELI